LPKILAGFDTKIRFILLLTALNICSFAVYGQFTLPLNRKEAALTKKALQGELSDSVRIELVWNLGKYQMLNKPGNYKINLDSAMLYFKYALKLVDSLKMKANFRYECMCRIGEVYFLKKEVAAGKSIYKQIISEYQRLGDQKREARTWFRMGIKLKNGEPRDPEIPYYLKKTLIMYTELKQWKEVGDVMMEKGIYNKENLGNIAGNLDSAENQFIQAIKLYQKAGYRDHNLSLTYYNLSVIYRNMGKLDQSLANSFASIRSANAIGDTTTVGTVPYYGQLGLIYTDLGNFNKSAENYRKAIALALKNRDKDKALDITYNYLNELVRSLISGGKAKEAAAVSRRLMKQYPPADTLQYGLAAEISGRCFEAFKQYPDAERSFLSMIDFYRKSASLETWGYKVLSSFYLKQNKYALARKALRDQYNHLPINTMAFSTLIDDELSYFKIDSAEGNLSSAIAHLKRYKALSDSAFNVTKSNQLARLNIQYEIEKKENDIIILKKDAQLEREKTSKAYVIRNLTLGAIVALAFFMTLLYRSYLANQRKNNALNILVDDKDQLLEQKEWLLKEVHHRVKNNLQIVMGLLQSQSAFIKNKEALRAIRNSENRMHSVALIHQKLYQSDSPGFINMAEYIDELINYVKDSFDLGNRIHFKKHVVFDHLNVNQALPLGLIMNEAITNTIKYAFMDNAYGTVTISFLRMADGFHCLKIQDDGPGFPPDLDPLANNSMGMNLMRGLSKQIGGELSIESAKGTSVCVTFKMDNLIDPILNE
jgi:two-component sensor histidine kinase/tetratricopeptide (TPR) repeat protein